MTTATSLSDLLPPEALSAPGPAGALASLAAEAEAFVHASSTDEVGEVLRWATANEVGVLPAGSGERLPHTRREGRFVVLATDRLTGLEIYEPADVTFTAMAGTRLSDMRDTLAEHRQWLPYDPPHVDRRTVGGLVATGESGPVGTGYGELRNHVLGATVVTGDGRILHLGGRVVKNVAGFDLLRPVVGSRGRLGVITSVCLRAFPMPAEDRVLVLAAGDLAELVEAARGVRTAPVLPVSAAVYAPARALGAGAALVVRLQGGASTVDADRSMLERHCGVTFDEASDPTAVREELRDHADDDGVVLRMALLPSRLFQGLAAVRGELGAVEIAADAYQGTARIAAGAVDGPLVAQVRAAIEKLGGTLGAVSSDPGSDVAAAASQPSGESLRLASQLEGVFDPAGVLWPCRT